LSAWLRDCGEKGRMRHLVFDCTVVKQFTCQCEVYERDPHGSTAAISQVQSPLSHRHVRISPSELNKWTFSFCDVWLAWRASSWASGLQLRRLSKGHLVDWACGLVSSSPACQYRLGNSHITVTRWDVIGIDFHENRGQVSHWVRVADALNFGLSLAEEFMGEAAKATKAGLVINRD
jgi:hypothetical protein